MDINSGKLYTPEEVQRMSQAERRKLKWISSQEFAAMVELEEKERPKALARMRAENKKAQVKKRKAQKKARRKNR